MKFKRGDKVVCISTDGGYERHFTIGKIYEIDTFYLGNIVEDRNDKIYKILK